MNNNITLWGILLLLLIPFFPLSSQIPCGTSQHHAELYSSDPNYRHDFDVRMQHRNTLLENALSQDRLFCANPIIVPVAVHYRGVTGQSLNCLTDLALFQIDELNKEFSATNDEISNFSSDIANTDISPTSLAAEGTCIQFCLADADHPPGSGLTDGEFAITINAGYTYFFTDPMWAGYMNIVVASDLLEFNGYAEIMDSADGSSVVVSSCVWGRGDVECGGSFGSGTSPFGECQYIPPSHTTSKTTTHEIGHFLGLFHIWESANGSGCDNDDGFSDTPDAGFPSYGCPLMSEACGSNNMFMNYMDYSFDECRYMFSEQQAIFLNSRASEFWGTTSTKCSGTFSENDASIQEIVFPVNSTCGTSVAPIIRLENAGSLVLSSVDISYSVVGGGSGMYTWSGSLPAGQSTIVNLPAIASTGNDFTLIIQTSSPNGTSDDYIYNDDIETDITIIEGIETPFYEDLEDFNQPFPAQGATIFSTVDDDYDWEKKIGVSSYDNGFYSIHFNNFSVGNSSIGNDDWFLFPEMDITGYNSVNLSFDMAYTYYMSGSQTRSDEFKVMYSLGCSNEWQEVWYANGTDWATAPPSSSIYQPSGENDWVTKDFAINTNGSDFIRIAFVNITGKGNSLYLDNINIQGSTAIVSTNEIESLSQFDISPNPSQGYLNVNVEFEQNKQFEILIHDVMGRELYYRKQIAAISNEQLDLSTFSNGVYLISIRSGNQIVTEKIVLNK